MGGGGGWRKESIQLWASSLVVKLHYTTLKILPDKKYGPESVKQYIRNVASLSSQISCEISLPFKELLKLLEVWKAIFFRLAMHFVWEAWEDPGVTPLDYLYFTYS